MEAANTRAGSAQRRRSKAPAPQPRASVLNGPAPLAHLAAHPAPLVDRLQLTWQSLPPRREARLYSPSTTQLLPVGNNGSSPASSKPAAHPSKSVSTPAQQPQKKTSSTQQLARAKEADVAAFELKYAVGDPLMRYVLHVIRSCSSVRRSEIPRGKHIQRKVCPEEDVLYLVACKTPPCGFRNVYWLTFSDEGTILRDTHAEYFTLSSHGLTRFKGGQGVEFSDLPVWVDEKRAFDHMTSMKGLERIQQMIFFFSWKRQAVQRRLHRVQERLACSLFTCHPVAAQLLMDVRDVCAEIQTEAERDCVCSDTSYTLELLARIQHDRARDAKAAIAKKIRALCVAIDSATRNISRYRDDEECSYAVTDHEAFSKSLRLSSLRARMFTFLRLVDCHLTEAIYQHVTVVVRDLRSRICGQPRQGEASVLEEQRSGYLCELESTGDSRKHSRTAQTCQRVAFTVHGVESGSSLIAFPGLYVCLQEDVDFEGDVNTATMHFSPSKVQAFELVHSILLKYCVAMDGLPRVLTDAHFAHALTPFVPLVRREFIGTMLKPSHLVLERYERELREMRAALDMHYRRVGILQQEHLRCVRAIKVAERESPVESTKRSTVTESDDEDTRLPELPDLATSATAYELAQKTWSRFVHYADTAAPMLQVGYLLLDQRSLVDKLRVHVSKRVAEMDDALPSIYQQFLASLLQDVDGRIEKVTKIPITLAEANTWLSQVTSMMPMHPFRQRLDAKRANLARLRVLIKEHGLNSLDQETQDSIRKLELTWESVIETLLMCLARVEERGSEHRRSVQDVITKVDEFINGQLQVIVTTFEALPSGCEEDEEGSSKPTDASNEELVQQLEDLVAMDLERKNVVQQFEEYDREHRAIMDMPPLQQPAWTSTSSESTTTVSLTDKLPSELLLLYIVTSLELRQWFESWNKMRDKWLGSPLTGVHPGTMINRIKQFRRRLSYASSRLSRLSSVLLHALPFESSEQHQEYSQGQGEDHKKRPSFSSKDFELMRAFDDSIEEMLNCNRIFQAISGGAVSEARWTAINHLLNVQPGSNGAERLTLRRMKEQCTAGQIEAFLEVCDECIVEAKLHVKLEQARQRLARIEIRVEETNYSVRCERVAEALAQLDDIAMDLKLCLFGQNPELQACLELRDALERKVIVCGHILTYQKHWRLRCEATKLHEVDEFFSKRFGGGGGDLAVPRARRCQKSGFKQEQSVWQEFLDASHAWSDQLRRLFFVSSHEAQGEQDKARQVSSLGRKRTAVTASPPAVLRRRLSVATKTMDCTLHDVVESFEGFDFEANFAACERGMNLVRTYLNSLREKTPRMFCLDEELMLRLLLRDSDVRQLHQSLAVCFPRVHRFAISRAVNRIGSTVEPFGKESATPVKASSTDGTIVIIGIEGLLAAEAEEQSGRFRLPVAKIGRVKFWFTRLEEEMSSMVVSDLKRAFEWVTSGVESAEIVDHNSLLPQSIATACGLLLTYEMNHALHDQEGIHQKLDELQLKVNGRLEDLVTARKTASASIRLESMIILSVLQSQVVRNVADLSKEGRHEDALFFWSLQFQIRAFVETIPAPGSVVQPSPGKHGKVERSELLPTSSVSMKVSQSSHSGQSMAMSVYCQVAHLQLPLGQEFVGWERLAILSPFTQRCAYALFSALKMHHSALIVPFNAGQDPSSLLAGVGSMLMRPCIEFSCHPSAGVAAVHDLHNLMSATSRLNGFLVVRHLLQLSAALVGVVQQQILQHFHQGSSAGTRSLQQQAVANSLVLPRQHGGLNSGASAIFVPMDSVEDLHQSGLIQSIRTQFRAVGVTRPATRYVAECLLFADGFTRDQIKELHVVEAFEAVETEAFGSFDVSFVVQEARRLRELYRVVWDSQPLTRGGNAMKTLLQGRKSNVSGAVGRVEICDGQCVFRHAFMTAIKKRLILEHGEGVISRNERVELLLAGAFPRSEGGRLVAKGKGDEEAVAAAVSIYLESAYSLPADCAQFELIMELWRALQTFPAALVCGGAGSGKSSCITALHRALVALELSERSQENEGNNSQTKPPPALTQLVVLNPQLLTLDQLYTSVAGACSVNDSKKSAPSSLKWVFIDGELDGSVLERLLLGDNRAVSSVSSLPSSSVLYRGPTCSILSGDYTDTSPRLLFEAIESPRLLFEAIEMASLSPSALAKCWMLHVPAHCITTASIAGTWRARWEHQLVFPPDSRGFEAMTVVFKTVDVLVLNVCVRFVHEEAAPDQGDPGTTNSANLRLASLSLNHMTQTALKMVSLCCFQNRSLLQELSFLRLVELVAFTVLWGVGGHLADPLKHKLENFVRVKSKEYSETKHLADLPLGLMDANHFEDVWDELQPKLAVPLTSSEPASRSKPEAKLQSSFDASSGQILVLVPAATSIVRLCTLLLHSSHSFLLIGPAASGKTSLLRWLLRRNCEAEAAEMKVETSIDERHVHGILDWMGMPAAWFNPLDERDSSADSRAKMREETELFSARSQHSFVFLDDLDASGETAQGPFIRSMLDHRLGYSTKSGGFRATEKHIGAAMRLDETAANLSAASSRLLRHFSVFRVPSYTHKDLLSVFRVKFQHHFKAEISRTSTERRLSVKGGGGGQQLSLEEVILRASVDFAAEISSLQQLEDAKEHPCLFLFNLHHVNTLLDRTLAFATEVSDTRRGDANQGTSLVMLGKAHQSWLSELQNVFLANCPPDSLATGMKTGVPGDELQDKRALAATVDDTQRKLSSSLRHLSEKYFSVALRTTSDSSFPISVEALHFLVKLAERHVQAPLLQPRLLQLRELLSEHMTAANGVSRRSSDQARGASGAGNWVSSPVELVSSVLLEIAAASSTSEARRPYSTGQLTAIEMKLLLSSSWCLTQTAHLVHALSRQQQIVVSSPSSYSRLLADRLLRFACDFHGFKVHLVEDSSEETSTKKALQVALAAAGVRQERVALWVHQRQLTASNSSPTSLAPLLRELCTDKLPSIALLPGGEELRDELMLSCIQSRKQLQVVTEAELLAEFQQRLKDNFRLCIIEESEENPESSAQQSSTLVRWMKTRPSCHWRRLQFTDRELQRSLPEMARAALTSSALCGLSWDVQLVAKYVALCQNVHAQLVSASQEAVDPTAQQDYFLSFLANTVVTYRAKLACHHQKVNRLETSLGTLTFASDKVVPALVSQKHKLELECAQIGCDLETASQLLELQSRADGVNDELVEETPLDPETEENRWTLRARYEELMMMNAESKRRLDEVSKLLVEWQRVAERTRELLDRWTRELNEQKRVTSNDLLAMAMLVAAQRSYTHVTALPTGKRITCQRHLHDLILEGVGSGIVDVSVEADGVDASVGISKLIWTSRFPFLHNVEIYRSIRLADDICDQVPVLVDPSGVLQRFLVHIFSGHTLYSTLPGCGTAGEIESENPSLSKESMVISCDDPKLESLLQEAQRSAVPVLLINFRSADKRLVRRLQPFLRHASLSHAPPRRAMLHELTMKFYEDQRKQKQRRTSIAGSAMAAMSSLAQTAASVGGGAALVARRTMKDRLTGRHRTVVLDPMTVAAVSAKSTLSPVNSDAGKTGDRRDGRSRNAAATGSTASPRGFQIYAVSSTPVAVPAQHELASQFAHFAVCLTDSELVKQVEISRVGKTQHSLLQELRGDQIGLADCWVRLLESRDQLWELLVKLKPAVVLDESPFASQKASGAVTIHVEERYSELAAQLGNEHQAELIWKSREQLLQAKHAELVTASNAFAPLATRVVGMARCVAVMSSMKLGARTSPFYPQSFRYLENVVTQQLAAQNEDATELLASDAKSLISRIGSGFVSESHRLIFRLLETFQRQDQTRISSRSDEVLSVWKDTVVWILSNRIHSDGTNDSAAVELMDETETCQALALPSMRRSSLKWPGDSGASLVERLRRRVKLCAYLFNGWKPSHVNRNPRGKQTKVPRHGSTAVNTQNPGVNIGNNDSNEAATDENREFAISQLQESLDKLLSASETLWYEWKMNRVRVQLDMQRLISALGFEEVLLQSSSERSVGMIPGPTTLLSLKELLTRYKLEKTSSVESWRQELLPMLLAKTFYQSRFVDVLTEYLGRYSLRANDGVDKGTDETWTAWQPPASLVADVSPSRGKNSRAHLPRALILYARGERNNVSLKLSTWDIAVFVETDSENVSLRDELTMLITTKHKFILEVLDAKHAEAALALVSQLINENALLSVPEWYLLATFTVATAIENGKLAVMDRIAVFSPADEGQLSVVGRGQGHGRTADLSVQHKLVEDCGLTESSASALTLAVLSSASLEDTGAVVRDLADLVLRCGSIEESCGDHNEQERATERLRRVLTENQTIPVSDTDSAASSAKLSAEVLSDLLSVANASVRLLTGESEDEWLSRHSIEDAEAACECLWSSCCQTRSLFAALKVSSADLAVETLFFPWQSFDVELATQSAAFDAVYKHLSSLRLPATRRELNWQLEFASLARGCLPFAWVESFFAGTEWPSQSSGTVSAAQMLLLIACRVGVLARCLRGDRAWALNLTVVSDACEFLRCLRSYTASSNDVPESSLVLVLELDAFDVADSSNEDEAKKRKALAIAQQLGAMRVDTRENDWHGAVLRQTDAGVDTWGIRVDGLVLVEQAKGTKLYPMPTCRIMCQLRNDSTSVVEVPVVVLPSLSAYQPNPRFQDVSTVRVVLGRSINSVVDIAENSTTAETPQFAVGVPVFPDDESSDS